MPPRAKFSREEIIQAAFELTREKGIDAVVARELGKKLGTSSSPIFTAFENMKEVQNEVLNAATKVFGEYVSDCLKYKPAFKMFGIRTIQFAMEEPKLFQLIYMQEHEEEQGIASAMKILGDTFDVCIELIEKEYQLEKEKAEILFQQIWVFTFGICVLCASKVCKFTEKEISIMLGRAFSGMLMLIKEDKMQQYDMIPQLIETIE